MTGEVIVFFVLAIVAIACAVLLISSERMAHMILSMVFTFLAVAGIFFLLRAEFLGVVQIIVYAGAMAILFVFAVMMTEHKVLSFGPERHQVHKVLAFLGVGSLLAIMLYGISSVQFPETESPQFIGSAKDIGIELYGSYVIAFEAVAILLLVALVGAIVIARKEAD